MREASLVPAAGDALELGCGNGMVSQLLARCGYVVTGVDISPTAVKWAMDEFAAAGLAGTFFVGDVGDLRQLGNRSFDLIVDGNCLHCVMGAARTTALQEVARLLRPGGVFVVSSMVAPARELRNGWKWDAESRRLSNGDAALRWLAPEKELVAEVEACGLHIRHRHRSTNDWWDHLTLCATRSDG